MDCKYLSIQLVKTGTLVLCKYFWICGFLLPFWMLFVSDLHETSLIKIADEFDNQKNPKWEQGGCFWRRRINLSNMHSFRKDRIFILTVDTLLHISLVKTFYMLDNRSILSQKFQIENFGIKLTFEFLFRSLQIVILDINQHIMINIVMSSCLLSEMVQ